MATTPSDSPLLYLIVGIGESSRLDLVHYLVRHGLDAEQLPAAAYLSVHDFNEPAAEDANLRRYVYNPPSAAEPGSFFPPLDKEANTHFLLTDGRANIVEEIENLHRQWTHGAFALGRIITVVDLPLLQQHAALEEWYNAAFHFSDVILFANRRDDAKKWTQEFEKRLKRACLPSLTANLKKQGKVEKPVELLFPEPRRISQIFDPADDLDEADAIAFQLDEDPELVITDSNEGELADDRDLDESADAPRPGDLSTDPYTARNDHGQRIKKLPDLHKILSAV